MECTQALHSLHLWVSYHAWVHSNHTGAYVWVHQLHFFSHNLASCIVSASSLGKIWCIVEHITLLPPPFNERCSSELMRDSTQCTAMRGGGVVACHLHCGTITIQTYLVWLCWVTVESTGHHYGVYYISTNVSGLTLSNHWGLQVCYCNSVEDACLH